MQLWKRVKRTAAALFCAAVLCSLAYARTSGAVWYALAVTFWTSTYQICMHLWVGNFYNRLMHNHADYRRRWFRVSPREEALYRALKVRKWKGRLPTYDPESFNCRTHSWDTIAQTTCQSELVHETCAVLGLLPLAAVRFVGGFWAFFLTSCLVSGGNLLLVMVQRSNRARIVRLLARQASRPAHRSA